MLQKIQNLVMTLLFNYKQSLKIKYTTNNLLILNIHFLNSTILIATTAFE